MVNIYRDGEHCGRMDNWEELEKYLIETKGKDWWEENKHRFTVKEIKKET